jgi:N-acetylglucosaminyl-diphospho-decaprenol L-rhamnosyltransferase
MERGLDLSIIIVNWNSAEFVRRCLKSIRQHTNGVTYEIIVVDNASFDGCDRVVLEDDPAVVYIQSNENLGFAKANNRAFEVSKGRSLLFLNPDTEIVGPAVLLMHCALHHWSSAGAVGARLLNADGSLQTSCIQSFPTISNQVLDSEYLRRWCPESSLWGMAPLHRPTGTLAEVEVISGACLMIKRDVFERVGRFSEEYFMYAEDVDLCHKVRGAGLKSYYVPQATVMHFGGNSSRRAPSSFSAVMARESLWRFFRKTRGESYGFAYRCSMFLSALCRLAFLTVSVPIETLCRRQRGWFGSIRKWWAVLLWSLDAEAQAKRYWVTSTATASLGQAAEAVRGKC